MEEEVANDPLKRNRYIGMYEKGIIDGLLAAGQSVEKIAKITGYTHKTIDKFIDGGC